MAITYPITIPVAPKSYTLTQNSVVSMSQSVFTGTQYVQNFSGQWWGLSVTFASGNRNTHSALNASLNSLNGKYGTFKFTLSGQEASPMGVATGTPLVKGAGQGNASTLDTDGWTPSTTGILKAGDFIQVGDSLHQVLEDATSDSGGNATLSIFPNVRDGTADNAVIVTESPSGIFRMLSDFSSTMQVGGIYSETTIQAVEVL